MKKAEFPENRIKALRRERKWSGDKLALLVGIGKSYLSRLENSKVNLTSNLVLKFSAVFNCTPTEVTGIPVESKFASYGDETLVGAVFGYLLEANEQFKTKLTKDQLAKLATFIFKKIRQHSYSDKQIRELTYSLVEAGKIFRG